MIEIESNKTTQTFYQMEPKHAIINRSDKRKFAFEVNRFFPDLHQIEQNFLTAIFDTEFGTYNYYFDMHRKLWLIQCNWIRKQRNCKLMNPNDHYFNDMYKSLV